MSKTETVKALSDSPQAREQSQAMQTTRDLQNHVGDLAELLTSATYRLKETTDEAETSIQKANKRQYQLQKNSHNLLGRQMAVTKRQESAADRQERQIEQLIQNQDQLQRSRPLWLLAGVVIGALTASVTTFAITWLLM